MSSSSFQPFNAESPFLATSTVYPEEALDMSYALATDYQRTATAVNVREVAFYQPFESLTGQQWPALNVTGNVPYAFISSFRIMVVIPALVAGLNLIPHNISGVTATFVFTKMFGGIGNGAIWHAVPNDDIHLAVDAVNVQLTIPGAYAGFTGRVILEYLKAS